MILNGMRSGSSVIFADVVERVPRVIEGIGKQQERRTVNHRKDLEDLSLLYKRDVLVSHMYFDMLFSDLGPSNDRHHPHLEPYNHTESSSTHAHHAFSFT